MMITSMHRRRALAALDWTESRPSCASGLITSSVDNPTSRDQAASEVTSRVASLHSRARVGERSARFTALSSSSHIIQSP